MPPTLSTVVPNWREGDEIPLGHRSLRVMCRRDDDADQPPVLVVEDVSAIGAGQRSNATQVAVSYRGRPSSAGGT